MFDPSNFAIYLVTDREQTGGRSLIDVVASALRGGVRALQVRERDLATGQLLELARHLRQLTAEHGAQLLINERIDVALACGADGVHLPGGSFRVAEARALLGPGATIGVSTHGDAELLAAVRDGADFAVFGPIYDTPSKRRFGPPLGTTAISPAVETHAIPIVVIGGIDHHRAAEVRRAGAIGVAVIRAILAASDPERAARELADAGPASE